MWPFGRPGSLTCSQVRRSLPVTVALLAMLGQEDTVVLPILGKVGLAPLAVRNRLEETIGKLAHSYGSEAQMSRELRETLERADGERTALGDHQEGTEKQHEDDDRHYPPFLVLSQESEIFSDDPRSFHQAS